jgi:hypothetical protein
MVSRIFGNTISVNIFIFFQKTLVLFFQCTIIKIDGLKQNEAGEAAGSGDLWLRGTANN